MLEAVKLAVGGIMKFDPIKLNLDGKLVDFRQLQKQLSKENEEKEQQFEDR